MVVFSLLKSISGSSTLALKFTVLVAQNQKCVAGLAWPKAVSGVPVSLYPPRSKVQLYHIYIQPVLLYGSETWALTRALQDKVDAFDNMCLRRILRIPYTDHVTNATVRLQAGSPHQLSQLIQVRRLRFFGHVARMDTSLDITRALKVSIRGLPKDWRRPPGRPRHTWLRALEADLQPLNLGLNSAWKYTQDREHWKHLVETSTLQLGACSVLVMMMISVVGCRHGTC